MTVEELPYPDANELTDHWWWRPGWQVGTRFYAWHLTLDDQPDLQVLAARYRAALAPFTALDPIPTQWLHITMQGVGHVRDMPDDQRDGVIVAVQQRLSAIANEPVTFHHPVLHREAVVVPPTDAEALRRIRQAVRAGMRDALTPRFVPESDSYRPHVSLAYVNAPTDPAPIRGALDTIRVEPVTVQFGRVALIEIHRDRRMYEWRTIGHARLDQPQPP